MPPIKNWKRDGENPPVWENTETGHYVMVGQRQDGNYDVWLQAPLPSTKVLKYIVGGSDGRGSQTKQDAVRTASRWMRRHPFTGRSTPKKKPTIQSVRGLLQRHGLEISSERRRRNAFDRNLKDTYRTQGLSVIKYKYRMGNPLLVRYHEGSSPQERARTRNPPSQAERQRRRRQTIEAAYRILNHYGYNVEWTSKSNERAIFVWRDD